MGPTGFLRTGKTLLEKTGTTSSSRVAGWDFSDCPAVRAQEFPTAQEALV